MLDRVEGSPITANTQHLLLKLQYMGREGPAGKGTRGIVYNNNNTNILKVLKIVSTTITIIIISNALFGNNYNTLIVILI